MGIEVEIKKIKIPYNANREQYDEYTQGIEIFDSLIKNGFTQRRGNQLALPNELYENRIEFNN